MKVLKIVLRGLGVAGGARLKAIGEIPELELAGIVSRRPEVATLNWQEALADPNLDAVALSTENTDHPKGVREALVAGKHVLCDYPLCFSAPEAQDLFKMAKEKDLVLHVEHIGLITDDHRNLKEQARNLGPLKKGDYLFQGGFNEKLSNASRTGPLPILALSRLLQVADLFGPFTVSSIDFEKSEQGFYLHLHLKFSDGGRLGFTEERMMGLPRRRSLTAECEKGGLKWKAGLGSARHRTVPGSRGLFAKDLKWFCDRVLKGQPCYYDEALMIHVLGELEKVIAIPAKVSER